MKSYLLIAAGILSLSVATAQERKPAAARDVAQDNTLPDLRRSILNTQAGMSLFTQNLADKSKENDVNTIVVEVEKYIDSMPKNRSRADVLLNKYFAPLRQFFLTTTNKTTVATSFLYADMPFHFCRMNDTALTLYISAIKDGDIYNLGRMTEKRIAKVAFENCLLPSLSALTDFKDDEIKYIGLSIYYGCKDPREGAPTTAAVPYCMTIIARAADMQQYAAGLITLKGLMTNATIYLADEDNAGELHKIALADAIGDK